ncbi:hypothetical protein BU26DRAFT_518795 [Trematosphaeria pertusa]|uniref:Uncharacterized protein n=1 Tax=Trematosphaeria pertusa TaxID=390896 RepID=A0A6A6ILQ5_9PLEO|nr:uncharacterized protein BU26DRAFT_518795 [Trematosphaeria pertusa]KAF2250413.1 hypothetical protein BU26DRAFT_518795 [Trematosphaeria pertusa]
MQDVIRGLGSEIPLAPRMLRAPCATGYHHSTPLPRLSLACCVPSTVSLPVSLQSDHVPSRRRAAPLANGIIRNRIGPRVSGNPRAGPASLVAPKSRCTKARPACFNWCHVWAQKLGHSINHGSHATAVQPLYS